MLTKTAKADWTSRAAPPRRGWSAQGRKIGFFAIVGLLAALSTVVLMAAMALGMGLQLSRRACLAVSKTSSRLGPRVGQSSDI
ncbi:hypothetical protein [Aureimonas sp. AU12]|uniref:hypothetical protein n=1 Tax=Aureimonas sp. AU12 TaxID=1638161 RepID=UPI000782B2F7|nr:hypothetical protein [Aureimonas sp. AU12]